MGFYRTLNAVRRPARPSNDESEGRSRLFSYLSLGTMLTGLGTLEPSGSVMETDAPLDQHH